jgi:hypothetical protein
VTGGIDVAADGDGIRPPAAPLRTVVVGTAACRRNRDPSAALGMTTALGKTGARDGRMGLVRHARESEQNCGIISSQYFSRAIICGVMVLLLFGGCHVRYKALPSRRRGWILERRLHDPR